MTTRQIEISDLKLREIAEAIGYEKPAIISMFKMGITKVPLEKIPALAKVLGLGPAHLMTLALREYAPHILEVVQQTMGRVITENEFDLITEVRKVTKDNDPAFTKDQVAKVKAALSAH